MELTLFMVVAAALGGLFLLMTLWALRRRRVLAAGGNGLLGALFLALAALLGAISFNLHSYQRLTFEQPVAELGFHRLGPSHYQVHIRHADGRTQLFGLLGDEWQLDARVLKWKGAANLLGLDAQYRLERISGRYRDIEQARDGPYSIHPLSEDPGLDLWALAQEYNDWLPWVDTVYGSATYLPMAHEARYEVIMTQTGMVARPLNAPAEQAVQGWR